jgi:hypothetical protein
VSIDFLLYEFLLKKFTFDAFGLTQGGLRRQLTYRGAADYAPLVAAARGNDPLGSG